MATPAETEDIIVYKGTDKDTPPPNENTVKDYQLAHLKSAKMFKAIHNNDFANFQESSKTKYDDNINKNDERDKLYTLGSALNTPIQNNYLVDREKTLAKLDIPDKDRYLTPQAYILNRLEKIHSTYEIDDPNDPNNEAKKKNIKALWDILTYSIDDPKFKESNFKISKYFQPFLRKIMGDYKSIDEAIGKTEKDKFIEKYLDKTIAERYKSAKQGMSSVKDKFGSFFGKKTEAAPAPTDAAPVTTDAAPVTTDAASVTTTTTAPAATKKSWNPFSGGRKSRKQRKSKKQQKSRKHGKRSSSRK